MKEGKVRLRGPATPLPVLVYEAGIIYNWCKADRTQLVGGGLAWEMVEKLPLLCRRVEVLHAERTAHFKMLPIERKEVETCSENASAKRAGIARKIRLALKLTDSDQRLARYHRRRSFPLLVDDLLKLVALGRNIDSGALVAGFGSGELDDAEAAARELEAKYTAYQGRRAEILASRFEYFSQYHALYRNVQAIRGVAFAVFPAGSPRRAGYRRTGSAG